MKGKSKITSSRGGETNSRFVLGDNTYEVATEDLGVKRCKIVTRIYMKGEILYSTATDYSGLVSSPDFNDRLKAMIEKQHRAARDAFIAEQAGPKKSKAHFAQTIKQHLAGDDKKGALTAAKEALENFPADPFFLSHYGYLAGVVDKKWREGAKLCEDAIRILRATQSVDMAFFLPIFYLNLGRVYLKVNKKSAALNAFRDGLQFDSSNAELLAEIKGLGVRKDVVVPFLGRGNAINKYLGRLRHNLQKNR